jgi:peptidoglycan L-alanyl-D-glutamate endopeptidase CwlK
MEVTIMNARSEAVLATVNPTLADKVRDAAEGLAAGGIHLLVVSGLRTAAEQDALYEKGRDGSTEKKVTNAKAGYSMHNYGLAVDVVPFSSGEAGEVNWDIKTPQFEAMVSALKAQGLVWGGDWVRFPDDDHFQMPGLPDTPNDAMRADYGDGDKTNLAAIWSNVTAGSYVA